MKRRQDDVALNDVVVDENKEEVERCGVNAKEAVRCYTD